MVLTKDISNVRYHTEYFFVMWVILPPQDKNVIGTKIENCSIPPFKQGVKTCTR